MCANSANSCQLSSINNTLFNLGKGNGRMCIGKSGFWRLEDVGSFH